MTAVVLGMIDTVEIAEILECFGGWLHANPA
jgi:hypothetical protein